MRHPFQKVAYCASTETFPDGLLAAAEGPFLHILNLSNGELLDTWPKPNPASSEQLSESRKEQGSTPSAKPQTQPNIIKLLPTPSGTHIILATDTDKAIHVLSLSPTTGTLTQDSKRHMPKRPSALSFIPSSTSPQILVGDKFGDVYSLPLHYDPSSIQEVSASSHGRKGKPYKPAADVTTVHSRKNREALERQLAQAAASSSTAPAQSKAQANEPLNFPHELLLGHVSMLTDLTYTRQSSIGRSYIITSDRDEHIRISRGPPQAHIIETYCLGHREFVSKVCLLDEETLVSGGGDEWVGFWDFATGVLRRRVDLRGLVEGFWREWRERDWEEGNGDGDGDGENGKRKIAVSGLWRVETKDGVEILAALEGVPALFRLHPEKGDEQKEREKGWIALPEGNVLDVAVCGPKRIVVSYDSWHKPWSTTDARSAESEQSARLRSFHLVDEESNDKDSDSWVAGPAQQALDAAEEGMKPSEVQDKASLHNLLYGIENLRKRAGEDRDDQ